MPAEAPGNTPYCVLQTPVLIGDATRNFGALQMKESIRGTASTTQKYSSKPSVTKHMVIREGFRKLYVGDKFLDRLLAYVDPSYDVPGPGVQTQPYRLSNAPMENDHVYPSTGQVVDAVIGMKREEMGIRERTPLPLTTDGSVHDAVGRQIFPILNEVIGTKEVNTIELPIRPAPPGPRGKAAYRVTSVITGEATRPQTKEAETSQWRDHFETIHDGQLVDLRDAANKYFFPQWTRSAPALLKITSPESKAGLADYVLLASPSNTTGTVVANCELRPPWVYTTLGLWGIYYGELVLAQAPHLFNKALVEDPICDWLKMLLIQTTALKTHIGFFTNMDVIIFYCYNEGPRSGGRDGTEPGLVLSWPMSFTHPLALRCLQGMTFLALDAARWHAERNISLIDMVAPGNELRQIVPEMVHPVREDDLVAPPPLAFDGLHIPGGRGVDAIAEEVENAEAH